MNYDDCKRGMIYLAQAFGTTLKDDRVQTYLDQLSWLSMSQWHGMTRRAAREFDRFPTLKDLWSIAPDRPRKDSASPDPWAPWHDREWVPEGYNEAMRAGRYGASEVIDQDDLHRGAEMLLDTMGGNPIFRAHYTAWLKEYAQTANIQRRVKARASRWYPVHELLCHITMEQWQEGARPITAGRTTGAPDDRRIGLDNQAREMRGDAR